LSGASVHTAWRHAWEVLRANAPDDHPRFADYEALLPDMEAWMWARPETQRLARFQDYCREMEEQGAREHIARHRILVVVPVADRPSQLAQCIDSLVACQAAFGYRGGLGLVVVEDSADPAHAEAHRALLQDCPGLDACYLGLDEQQALLKSLDLPAVEPYVGRQWQHAMGHKGASVTRNIAMLWLARQGLERPLFHFIDSDQAFHVDVGAARPRYMLNYFYHLDSLFRRHDITALTGKVVGDPPVSPAVMAGTLLQDLNGILEQAVPRHALDCGFHAASGNVAHGAYHDMAAMFGLDNSADGWRYVCPLRGAHTHAEALELLSRRLLRFFDGEHPTRSTPFECQPVEDSLAPARTVYTGNYVINTEGLRHGIPFAPMKLRMAGPTLGRLLQAQLGERFVQANLPLLHQRADSQMGRAEFRPGVVHEGEAVDLSGEYERQFIGDWMLFGMIDLLAAGYPGGLDRAGREALLRQREKRLLETYRDTRARVMRRREVLVSLLDRYGAHWGADQTMGEVYARLRRFDRSLEQNYSAGSAVARRLEDAGFRDAWRARLLAAIERYPAEQAAWRALTGG
jgi:hypothetical protein